MLRFPSGDATVIGAPVAASLAGAHAPPSIARANIVNSAAARYRKFMKALRSSGYAFDGQYIRPLPVTQRTGREPDAPGRRVHAPSGQPRLILAAIGMRRPTPKALVVTLIPGAAWARLYSLRSTMAATFLTTSAAKPRPMISSTDRSSST